MKTEDPMTDYNFTQKPWVKFVLGLIFLFSFGIIIGIVLFAYTEFTMGLYFTLASSGLILMSYGILSLGKRIYLANEGTKQEMAERKKRFEDAGLNEFEKKQKRKRAEEIDLENSPFI